MTLSRDLRIFTLYFLFPLCVFLTLNKHSEIGKNDYRRPLFGDAAGYNSYLPYLFVGAEKVKWHDPTFQKTGNGFIYSEDGVLKTKYPCGVAILQSPFFLVAHLLTAEEKANGYSDNYQNAVNFAAITYGWLALLLLSFSLRKRFAVWIAYLVPLLLFFGTNLYWYMIDGTGMAHVYSFFLSSLLVFVLFRFSEQPSFRLFLAISFTSAMIVLVRPLDLPVLILLFFLGVQGQSELRERFKIIFTKPLWIITGMSVGFLVFLPQLLYWKHAFGTFLYDSYQGESFNHLLSPNFLDVLFSTKNGWLSYSPLLLFAVVGTIFYARTGSNEGRGILLVTFIAFYLISSWHDWLFGCAYGGRSFISLYPFLGIGLAWLLSQIKKKWLYYLAGAVGLGCILMNMDMIYYYDGCFYGDRWDWDAYFKLLD